MTTDIEELSRNVHDHPSVVTPLLDRAHVTDAEEDPVDHGFVSAPMPIVVETAPSDDSLDAIKHGEIVARNTYDGIVSRLQDLRGTKEDIQNEINYLVEQEQIWRPIVNRLDTGIRHRTPKDGVGSDQDQGNLLDT